MSINRALATIVAPLLAFALTSCEGSKLTDNQKPGFEQDLFDDTASDASSDQRTPPEDLLIDDRIATEDVSDTTPTPDTDVTDAVADGDLGPDPCDAEDKPFGCPCENNGDCLSGFCIESFDGGLCSQECIEDCPDGWECKGTSGFGADIVFLCIPPGEGLCQPCDAHADCDEGGLCLSIDGRMACTDECASDAGCPGPFQCVRPDPEADLFVCIPDSGSCDCLPGDAGSQRACELSNPDGACPGMETCDPTDGWSTCDAPEPEPEICDGVDNDCNGVVDDDLPATQPCENAVEGIGICGGLATCLGPQGWICTAPIPALEICDFQDNDCDGEVDEDFKVDGSYAVMEHCGTCGQGCEGLYSNANIICDGSLSTPLCVVETCYEGFYKLNDYQCLPEGQPLCKPCVNDLPCEGGTCIQDGAGAGYCSQSCDDEACPDFYTCEDVPALGGAFCAPASGTCDCGAGNDGATRPCSISGEAGTCFGVETCDALAGWVDCTALLPTEETCDGLDNDCDGVPDDALPLGEACDASNEFGVCDGFLICEGMEGWVCTAEIPTAELCDYLDNDCDGEIDEDFLDDNKYADLQHCGQCGKDCDGALPNATAFCDASPATPACKVEVCDDGFFQLNEVQCIAPPDVQCLPCDGDCYFGKCVPTEQGSFCMDPCVGEDDCGDEASCTAIAGFGEVCFPTTGSCECNAASDGATLSCTAGNEHGTCFGIRICDGASGWSDCDAPIPTPEVCDGIDNDCDGIVDEDLPLTQPCAKENQWGSCDGVANCQGQAGWVCQAQIPGAEACDYVDNDCDGLVDEDFLAGSKYVFPEHCGVCNNACVTAIENATGTCDPSFAVPKCIVDSCDEGYVQVSPFLCIIPPDTTCQPCEADGDCLGGTCITLDGTSVCAIGCAGDGDCADGNSCQAVDGEGNLCLPATGSCDCNSFTDGAKRSCFSANEIGTCFGFETCDAESGWSACDAPFPADEVCNGSDDDCDGLIDEDLPQTKPCAVENDFGSCEGIAVCLGTPGWVCQAPVPAPEICDYVDNDCSGVVDEDFLTMGEYTGDDHCGICGNACAGAFDHATGLCDPSFSVPKCVVEVCDEGYVQVSPFQCIPEPDTTCQECVTAQDCLGGDCVIFDGKPRCTIACETDEDCIGETSCLPYDGLGDRCQPDSGSCECNAFTQGTKRTCSASNLVGTCFGFETCDPETGWSACNAMIPSEEACNGVDDDCNGIIDDALPLTQGCAVENDFGSCEGLATCVGSAGWICQAPQPTQELCDYQDNDCDGEIDEDFRTGALYTVLGHCGECNNDCEGALPNAVSQCDVAGGAPTCKVEECLPGFFPLNEFQCIDPPDVQCSECSSDDDCYFGKCVTLELTASCLMPCGDGCDDDYSCQMVDGDDICVPDSGSCACSAATAGATISCSEGNGFGTCFGVRICDPLEGWSDCNAPTPVDEICDGVDNDCDGGVDEGLPVTQPCAASNEFGTCDDVELCLGNQGWVCQATQPALEACDFADNDCDGVVDEGFLVGGKYVTDDHCGTCNNPCGDAIDFATGVCDPSYATPKCVVGQCEDGYFQVSPFQCVLPPDTTCQPCSTAQDCFGAPCVDIDGQSRCAIECDDDGDCDDGNACEAVDGSGTLCVPETGSCECNSFTAGTKRACSATNGIGTCLGFETCDPVDGWSACDAMMPAEEACDGLDNDCDGMLDDGLPLTIPCDESNGFGTCEGLATCSGTQGWVCDAMVPLAESCNGIDDDCDGSVDEDFKNGDGDYAVFGHCGQCNLSCAGGFPNATAWCNDEGSSPECQVQGCDEGYFKFDDYQCIPDSSALCQPCETAADCQVGGAACVTLVDGAFCFKPCDDDLDCPNGYGCTDAGGGEMQCLPVTNACTCTGSELDLTRSCGATWPAEPAPGEEVTSCLGTQFCTVDGWGDCALPMEACDGLDNDCDGDTDEDFIVDGQYVTDEDCGQCGNDCTAQAPVNAVGYCDDLLLVPACGVICVAGFFDVNALPADGCECEYLGTEDLPDDDCVDPPDCSEHAKDQNCDGVDGEIENAIFVAVDGSDLAPGTIDAPKATIQAGIEAAASGGKRDVYVSEGTYPESISLLSGVGLYGGYSIDFSSRDVLAFNTTIQGQPFTTQLPATVNAFGIDGLPGTTIVDGFIILGRDQTTPGDSSFAIYLKDSTDAVRMRRNQVIAGDGGPGSAGNTGDSGDGGGGAGNGNNGSYHNSSICNEDVPKVLGGPGGAHVCGDVDTSGGKGGDSWCPHFEGNPDPGEWGIAGVGDAGGEGGEAGVDGKAHHASCKLCTFPNDELVEGQDGQDGDNGLNGLPGLGCVMTTGHVEGGFWVGGTGLGGSPGTPGTGGGGGGAGGGADSDTSKCLDVFGGTGGGGGAGGCPGTGGFGGHHGGGSFGFFLTFTDAPAALPELSDNLTVAGLGGAGGQGGTAGSGGLGSAGGFGGTAGGGDIYCAFGGGQGGNGGIGGHGGGGGGGCGGVSYCMYVDGYVGGLLLDYKAPNNGCIIGAPGPGGLGGVSLGVVGFSGQSGIFGESNF